MVIENVFLFVLVTISVCSSHISQDQKNTIQFLQSFWVRLCGISFNYCTDILEAQWSVQAASMKLIRASSSYRKATYICCSVPQIH